MARKRRYAQNTTVPIERSQAAIRKLLDRVDADQFMFGGDGSRIVIGFRAHDRYVRIDLPIEDDKPQTERMKWRHAVLYITARVTEIQNEMLSFDEAFLPNLVLPDGSTFRDLALPAVTQTYETGELPALLPGGSS